MFTIDDIFKYILEYEYSWCEKMKFFNPYLDPFDTFISNEIPNFDNPAFFKYTKHNFVYDKLWVVKSQGLMGGTLNTFTEACNCRLRGVERVVSLGLGQASSKSSKVLSGCGQFADHGLGVSSPFTYK